MHRDGSARLAVPALLLMLFACALPARAVELHAGDLVVASTRYGLGGPIFLWQVDPARLDTTRIGDGPLLRDVRQLAMSPDGGILVADALSGLLRVDPASGAQQLLAAPADLGGNPGGVAVKVTGQVFVSLSGVGGASIVEVTPSGALVRTVTREGHLSEPASLVVAPLGELYVAETKVPGTSPSSYGSIVRVDPATGAQSVLASGGVLYGPYDLALTPSGVLYAANRGTLSRRDGKFTTTRLADGFTDRDPTLLAFDAGFVTRSGSEDLYVNYCSAASLTCDTAALGRISAATGQTPARGGLLGPMLVVPAGATPARPMTWGRLKTLYR